MNIDCGNVIAPELVFGHLRSFIFVILFLSLISKL